MRPSRLRQFSSATKDTENTEERLLELLLCVLCVLCGGNISSPSEPIGAVEGWVIGQLFGGQFQTSIDPEGARFARQDGNEVVFDGGGGIEAIDLDQDVAEQNLRVNGEV